MWSTFVPKTHLSRAAIQFLLGWQGPGWLMPASPCWGPGFWPLSAGPVPPLTRQSVFFCSATFYLKMNGNELYLRRPEPGECTFQRIPGGRQHSFRKVLSQRDSAEGHGYRNRSGAQSSACPSCSTRRPGGGWRASLRPCRGPGRLPEGAPPAFRGCPSCALSHLPVLNEEEGEPGGVWGSPGTNAVPRGRWGPRCEGCCLLPSVVWALHPALLVI